MRHEHCERPLAMAIFTDECQASARAYGLGEARPSPIDSIRVLANPIAEALIGRAHPVTPILWFGPVIVFGWYHALAAGRNLISTAALFLSGWLAWTLIEYLLHRVLFHMRARTPAGRLRVFLLHGYHHTYPNDRMRLVAPPLMSWPPAIVVALCYYAAFPTAWAPIFAGTAAGYVAYDWVHYYTHHFRPRRGVGRWLRRYHMLHHYDDSAAYFGVSSPLWDLVFGTYRSP